jgi:hypothetical protein
VWGHRHGSRIVAKPASGRDVRRLAVRGSVFPIAEKCNRIVQLLTALGLTGGTDADRT